MDTVQEPTSSVIWPGVRSNPHGTTRRLKDERKSDDEDDDSDSSSDDDSASNTSNRPQYIVSRAQAIGKPQQVDSSCIPKSTDQPYNSRALLEESHGSFSGSSLTVDADADTLENCIPQNQKSRGSLDYLNDAISKFGK